MLADTLLDFSGKSSLARRFRALFALRNIPTDESVELIARAFQDKSALLKHEVAYVLGQMGLPSAIPFLAQVLCNVSEHEMVRHEAAEALGAIGHPSSVPLLARFLDDKSKSVAETCEIAIDRINHHSKGNSHITAGVAFQSVDPAPPEDPKYSITELESLYLNPQNSLYKRYKALFALRNMATVDSTLVICKGFQDASALFRHEVAYVLGQLQDPASAPSLMDVLKNKSEDPMVRHECAEALGSIATKECMDHLSLYLNDEADVVRESCEIALDIAEFENSNELSFI